MSYDDGPTGRQILGMGIGIFASLLVGIALITGLVAYGWAVNWQFTKANLSHQVYVQKKQAQIIQHNYAVQQSYTTAFSNYANSVTQALETLSQEPAADRQAIVAQALGDAQQACQEFSYLTSPDSQAKAWAKQNCYGTVVSPTSPIQKGKLPVAP